MSFFKSIGRRFLQSMEERAAVRVFEQIQHVDEAVLIQAGISPELLQQGPVAYPWRKEKDTLSRQKPVVNLPVSDEAAIRLGIRELSACSDSELHDLGITRGSIADVVRHGRPDVERLSGNQGRHAA